MKDGNFEEERMRLSITEKIKDDEDRDYSIDIKFSKEFINKYINDNKEKEVKIKMEKKGILTQKEAEIIKYLAQGKNNNEIAKIMYVSVHTTKLHLQNIFQKLEVNDRTLAVVESIRRGIIEI